MAESIAASEVVDPDLDIPQLNLPSGIVERAQGGDSFAQLDIGKAYYSASTLKDNCEKSFYWFKLSADLDNMEAQFKLGELYASGQGTKKDESTAYAWYLKSALQGYPKALIRIHDHYHAEENMYCRGQMDESEGEWSDLRFRKANKIRELYEYRVEQNKFQMTSIKRYFETLFKQCHEQVNNNNQDQKGTCLTLGFLYQNGYGIRKIRTRAIEFYTYPAEKNDATAQYNLGLVYHQIGSTERSYRDTFRWNSQAFKWTSLAADSGNCNAQNLLGYLYLKGLGVDQDNGKAMFWYKRAAENRCVDAMVALATIYRKGLIVDRDKSTAIKYYEMAIAEGNTVAQNALELLHHSRTPADPDEDLSKRFSKKGLCSRLRADALKLVELDNWGILKTLLTKALRKDPESMLEIGRSYFTGKYFDQDKDIGFRWMLKGAKGGSIEAQRTIAKMYKDGDFVEQNYHSVSVWCRRAAKKGDTDSQYKLGMMYHQGIGVREDHLEANKWYKLAVQKNSIDAMYSLGILYSNSDTLIRNVSKATECIRESARQKHPDALYILANWYEIGFVFAPDFDLATGTYYMAASRGSVDAQLKLAGYYSDTEIRDYNIFAASRYYRQASTSGDPKAKYELAILYLDGNGVKQDFIKAYHLFKESQQLKYTPAMDLFRVPIDYSKTKRIDYNKLMALFALVSSKGIDSLENNLGLHYKSIRTFDYNSKVVTCLKDTPSAIKWLEIAANKGVARAQNELGALFEADKESESSIQKSIYWYEEASKNGDLDATFTLACFYLQGKNVAQDLKKAFRLLYEISNLGHKEASNILHLSNTPYVNDNYSKVMKMLEGAAESGYASIQYWLGLFKLNNGSSNELQDAVRYLTMVSDGGHIGATYQLGVLFDEGTKVEQDYTKSIDYYQIAASKGDEHALFRLAQFYHFGKGCTQDYTKAYQLYVDAAQEGSSLAQIAITVTERSTWDDKKATLVDLPDEPLFNHDSCLSMWEYLAVNENVDLQYKLGTLYESMDGASNLIKAAEWYSRAVNHHHKDAMFRLGRFYQSGRGVVQNNEESINLYTRSEDGHNGDSLLQLGRIYLNRNQATSDPMQAVNCFKRAAFRGNSMAQYMLGRLYEMGKFEQQDLLVAYRWYTKSAAKQNYCAEKRLSHDLESYTSTYHEKKYIILSRICEQNSHYTGVHSSFYGSTHWKLGIIYLYGTGTQIDYEKAWDHFMIAKREFKNEDAMQISTFELQTMNPLYESLYFKKLEMFESIYLLLTPEDVYNLGMVYYKGVYSGSSFENEEDRIIVKPDYTKALSYFQRISKQKYGNVDDAFRECSYFLGMSNYIETAYDKPGSSAEYYLTNAIRAGHPRAEMLLAHIRDKKDDNGEIYKEVFNWHLERLPAGFPRLLCNVGYMYAEGIGTETDYTSAKKYYIDSTKRCYLDSYFKLGYMCHHKKTMDGPYPDYDEAVKWYRTAAAQGHVEAMFNLGVIYCQDNKSADQAYELFSHAAYQGHNDAKFELGNMYTQGLGIEIDYRKAIEWYTLAANNNHPGAIYRLGVIYEEGKAVQQNYDTAFNYYKASADQGNASALFKVGRFYHEGLGVQVDLKEAIKHYEKAVEKNHTEASYALAQIYFTGQGMEKNYTKALEYYFFPANDGHVKAQFQLGYMHHYGYGIEVNYSMAIEWYTRAAGQKYTPANFHIGIIFQTRGSYRDSFNYFKVAADEGNAGSQFMLGYFYHHGLGVDIDHQEAIKWYTGAAARNDIIASYNLGIMYNRGIGTQKGYKAAFEHYKVAANQGHMHSQSKLGYFYHQGLGVKINYSSAIRWYEKSAKQGDVIAAYNLGIIYENGDGVQKDVETAITYFEQAEKQGYAFAKLKLDYLKHRDQSVKNHQATNSKWYTKVVDQNHVESVYNYEKLGPDISFSSEELQASSDVQVFNEEQLVPSEKELADDEELQDFYDAVETFNEEQLVPSEKELADDEELQHIYDAVETFNEEQLVPSEKELADDEELQDIYDGVETFNEEQLVPSEKKLADGEKLQDFYEEAQVHHSRLQTFFEKFRLRRRKHR